MIRTLFISIVLAGLYSLQALCAPVQFKTDFSGGIPPEIILIDCDGNTPATAMASIGFEPGVAWIPYLIEDEQEWVACSTSWYKPSGTSDDWMILPPISVESGAILEWRARSSDTKYHDGYAVYVNRNGTDLAGFDKERPLFAIEESSHEWTSYSIELDDFVGEEISIAFVNNSTNKARLYVDDIMAGTRLPIAINIYSPALVKVDGEYANVEICGSLTSELEEPTILGDITLRAGDEVLTIKADQMATGTCSFTFGNSTIVNRGAKTEVTVSAHAANGYECSADHTIWPAHRAVFAEEFTGTWCSWCVRGIVFMEEMKGMYGDDFISLCVHEDDVMEVSAYVSGVDYLKEISIPNAIINRKYECDPSELEYYTKKALDDDPIEALITSMDLSYDSERSMIDIQGAVVFDRSHLDGHYAMGYIIAEDNVHVPGDPRYAQRNSYAGGANGAMGGFEDLPALISADDMYYHDVVREVSQGGPHGIPFSLPGTVKAGEEYPTKYEMQLPESILNPDEVYLVAIVIDLDTGEVLNAKRLALRDYDPTHGALRTVDTESTMIEAYTLQGMYVGTYPDIAAMRGSVAPGLYILRDNSSTTARKVLLRQ